MKKMNIGDRVRSLHTNEEGIIIGFKKNDIIEIEIEDGFSIDFLAKEVVLVRQDEQKHFGDDLQEQSEDPNRSKKSQRFEKPTLSSEKGVFIAFFDNGNDLLTAYLINNTDSELLYSVAQTVHSSYQGISAGLLREKKYLKLKDFNMKKFDNWATLYFRFLFHKNDFFSRDEMFEKRLKFKASTFFKNKKEAPLFEKEAYVFQIDSNAPKVNPEKVQESMTQGKSLPEVTHEIVKPQTVIDLHIEKLEQAPELMSNSEKLKRQLNEFENALANAIASGMLEITFIHGIGNGILRNEIHKRLSKNEHIKYYEDAQKNKFGYGATLIRIN
ncbi:MAG: DUF2027 domain-containing protein [Cytophagales bacterium]|nr:DUF2027 domain-containing protein [Cytophagales bacterium]